MLTALYSTLSAIVHSAGKHFAQPISITDLDKDKITNIRLFENRSFNADELFAELGSLMESAYKNRPTIREDVQKVVSTYHPAKN